MTVIVSKTVSNTQIAQCLKTLIICPTSLFPDKITAYDLHICQNTKRILFVSSLKKSRKMTWYQYSDRSISCAP